MVEERRLNGYCPIGIRSDRQLSYPLRSSAATAIAPPRRVREDGSSDARSISREAPRSRTGYRLAGGAGVFPRVLRGCRRRLRRRGGGGGAEQWRRGRRGRELRWRDLWWSHAGQRWPHGEWWRYRDGR